MDPNHPAESRVDELKNQAAESFRKVSDQISDRVDLLHDTAAIARHDAQVLIENNPWESVAFALGVGFVFGVALGRAVKRLL